MKFDIYSEITDKIIAMLEQGVIPWEKPWSGISSGAISHATGKPYSLINQLLLGEPGEYVTFNQCKQEGGSVKKGAKAKMVVFWKVIPKEKTDEDGKPVKDADGKNVTEGLPVLRYFNVFHISDCDGIAPKYPTPEAVKSADKTNGPKPFLKTISPVNMFALNPLSRTARIMRPTPTRFPCRCANSSGRRRNTIRPCFTKRRIAPATLRA